MGPKTRQQEVGFLAFVLVVVILKLLFMESAKDKATRVALEQTEAAERENNEKKRKAEANFLNVDSTGHDWRKATAIAKEKYVDKERPKPATLAQAMDEILTDSIIREVDAYYSNDSNLGTHCFSAIRDVNSRMSRQARNAQDIQKLQRAAQELKFRNP